MENKSLIIWEKWLDPFGEDTDEAQWRDYENNNDALYEEENLNDEVKPEDIISHIRKPIKVIASPMGLIPYNEYTASSKIFNFWMGHTNFNISTVIKDIIEKTEGVEILDIFTRYRFRIGIGKCFNDSETMKLINDRVYKALEESYAK